MAYLCCNWAMVFLVEVSMGGKEGRKTKKGGADQCRLARTEGSRKRGFGGEGKEVMVGEGKIR